MKRALILLMVLVAAAALLLADPAGWLQTAAKDGAGAHAAAPEAAPPAPDPADRLEIPA
ncbi:MAG: hypothetical protein H8E31_02120, partial [Planctomycetes bacterium]|nr:hypothetical protein [Planctomycetota bacterium]